MTTTSEPGVLTVLSRTVGAELLRLRTVRTTWFFALAATLGVVGLSLLIGSDARGADQTEPGETVWVAIRILGLLLMLVLLALASVSATADHGTGGIVPTLQWTPRRGVLLAARAVVVVATTVVLGIVLCALAAVLIGTLAPVLGLPWDEGVGTLGDLAYVYACGALLAVGTGLLLRSTAGTLVSVLALMLVLPVLLGNVPFGWAQDLARVLPGTSALRVVSEEPDPDLGESAARLVLAAWALGSLVVGGLRLVRSDADR